MDRQTANTLRTLGIVATTIFLIIACALLLLLSLCAGLLGGIGGSGGYRDPQAVNLFWGGLLGTVVLLAGGGTVIAKLARDIIRDGAAPAGVPGTTSGPTSAEFPRRLSPAS